MLGNVIFQILMFVIIWDIYLRIGGQNTNLKNRILYLLNRYRLTSKTEQNHD